MPVFGRNTIVGSDTLLPGGTGRAFMTRFALAEAGTVNHIAIYSTSTGGGRVRGAIYADNGGQPGALVALGVPVNVIQNAWVNSICAGQALAPGNYWLVVITEDFTSSAWADDIGGVGWAQ